MKPEHLVAGSRWVYFSIVFGAGLFVLALTVSAVFVPQLRLLHFFQALIYAFAVILTRRNNAWGLGAGVFIAIAWNSLNLFVTHLFQAGAGQLWFLLHTGHVHRPETMMVMVGGVGHFVLIVACVVGLVHMRPSGRDLGRFFGGGLLALAYFGLIVATMAPH